MNLGDQQFLLSILVISLLLTWLSFAVIGGIVGKRRNREGTGILLGLLFGPLGVVGAFALDGRSKCPQCCNRIENGVRMCQVCRAELAWRNGSVTTQAAADESRREAINRSKQALQEKASDKATHTLGIKRLKSISLNAAKALVRQGGIGLPLDGITSLDEQTAAVLASCEGVLSLNCLSNVPETVLRALSGHKGPLSLNGLTTLTNRAAIWLGQHEGILWLNGVTTLSVEAAKELAAHRGPLYLTGMKLLSDEAREALQVNADVVLPG